MQFQFDISSATTKPPAPPQPVTPETVPDLLRQILELQRDQLTQLVEIQKEQLALARTMSPDNLARWRQLLSRWAKDQPEFAALCKKAYPLMERAYVYLLVQMVDEIAQQGDEALDGDFAIQEFLDRFGMKVGQLSHLVSIVGPLADAANQLEEMEKQQKQQQQQG